MLVVAAILTAGGSELVAPKPAAAAHDGCARPYAATSPWNTPVGGAPRHPRSAFHVGALTGALSSDPNQYTYPVYGVTAATPLQTVTVSGWFSNVTDGGRRLVNQRGGTVRLPVPPGAAPAPGSDAQIILVDHATGDEWGASRFARTAGGYRAWNVYHYNVAWSGVPPSAANGGSFANRGAGVPYLAGLIRPCEIAAGRIDHALAFAYDAPRGDFVTPATKSDGASNDPRDLPEGARLQLNPDLTPAQIGAWGCGGACLTIARALQEYGMYVIDNSGRPKLIAEFDGTARWDGTITSRTVGPIPLTAFRYVAGPAGAAPVAASGPTCTITGTSRRDVLVGTAGRDVICGGAADDVLRGGGGDDVLYGASGRDVLDGGAGNDVLRGDTGRDRLAGGPGADRLIGGLGRDLLSGGAGNDDLAGSDGGRDRVVGGPGRDVAVADRKADLVISVERLVVR